MGRFGIVGIPIEASHSTGLGKPAERRLNVQWYGKGHVLFIEKYTVMENHHQEECSNPKCVSDGAVNKTSNTLYIP